MELQGNTGTKFLSGVQLNKGSLAYSEKDLHEDLFTCPISKFKLPEWNLTTLDSCESYGEGDGCKEMPKCKIYQQRKKARMLRNMAQNED